jgi:hypothetical protein
MFFRATLNAALTAATILTASAPAHADDPT